MRTVDAKRSFLALVRRSGLRLRDLRPGTGIPLFLTHYSKNPVEGCLRDGGDMLLFQWGEWSFGQEAPWFGIDITRQFIRGPGDSDCSISQLALTFRYRPDAVTQGIEPGSQWCQDRQDLEAFRSVVFSSPAFFYANFLGVSPEAVTVLHGRV